MRTFKYKDHQIDVEKTGAKQWRYDVYGPGGEEVTPKAGAYADSEEIAISEAKELCHKKEEPPLPKNKDKKEKPQNKKSDDVAILMLDEIIEHAEFLKKRLKGKIDGND